jgi:hypothetical protein
MVRRLKTSHAGAAHQYAPQEQYNNFHDGDTDEEIEMEPAPVVVPDLVLVSDDEEDPKEMIPEGDEPADQPNQEGRHQEKIWKITLIQRWRKKSKSKMKQLRK